MNADYVNTFLSAKQVGYYSMSVSFCSLLLFFETSSHQIMFPAFVKLKDDLRKTAFLYKNVTMLITIIEVIAFMALINNIDWLFPLILNYEKWKPTIPVIKWMAVLSIVNPFGIYVISLMQAHNKDKILLILAISLLIIQIILSCAFLTFFKTTVSLVWAQIIGAITSIICLIVIGKIIMYRNIFFKEYFYHISIVIFFTILYYSTMQPLFRVIGSIIIIGISLTIFYKFTFRDKFELLVNSIRAKSK